MFAPSTEPKLARSLQLALFAIGLLWLLAARVGAESAAEGIARLLHTEILIRLLNQIFFLVLLVTGFTALHWLGGRNGSLRQTNALPVRPTTRREWQKGAALGWAMALVALLPMMLAGDLHPQFWWAPRAWGLFALAALTLLVGTLATEVAFRGFLFQRLIAFMGPVLATVLLTGIYAVSSTSRFNMTPFSFLVSVLAGLLFSMAYLRTHALWLGWGLRFGWLASTGVLFGLPLAGAGDFANVVATDSSGSVWLTGGAYGPEGALWTLVVLIAGSIALYRLTREYAWHYTHPPIVPGGYPMDMAPPAAHAAMEAAAPPPPLVQILAATPTSFAAAPASVQPPLAVSRFGDVDGESVVGGRPSTKPEEPHVPGDPTLSRAVTAESVAEKAGRDAVE